MRFIVSGLVQPERFLDGLVGELCPSQLSFSHLAWCDGSLCNEPPFALVKNLALSWTRTRNTVTNFYSATSQKHHQWPCIADTTPCTLSWHGVDHHSYMYTPSNPSLPVLSLFWYLPLAKVKIKAAETSEKTGLLSVIENKANDSLVVQIVEHLGISRAWEKNIPIYGCLRFFFLCLLVSF